MPCRTGQQKLPACRTCGAGARRCKHMGPGVHEGHQRIALVVGRHREHPWALVHVDKGGGVERVHVRTHHLLEAGARKLADPVQLVFGPQRQRCVGAGQIGDHQRVAEDIGLCPEHDELGFGVKNGAHQQQGQQRGGHCRRQFAFQGPRQTRWREGCAAHLDTIAVVAGISGGARGSASGPGARSTVRKPR